MRRAGPLRGIAGLWLGLCAGLTLTASPAVGWDAPTHRAITLLALERLSKGASTPGWVVADGARARIAWNSGEPDRWRATRTPSLTHENTPEHYLDAEELEPFGLSLATLPRLRTAYYSAMVRAKAEHPERFKPSNPALDPAGTSEFPGALPYAILAHAETLRASVFNLRVLEALNDPARAEQIEAARANVLREMGILSHFVGDGAQPLHLTRHHHGWVGDNPKGYSTDKGIHALVDGGLPALHTLNEKTLAERARNHAAVTLDSDPWAQVIAYLTRSLEHVEPLYALEKSGQIRAEAGREFIAERLTDASAMLAALYQSAFDAPAPTRKEIDDFLRYDAAPSTPAPASTPAAARPKQP